MDEPTLLDTPEPSVVSAAVLPRRRKWRWVIIGVSGAVLIPFLFVMAKRVGGEARSVRSPLLGKPAASFDLPRVDAPGTLSSDSLRGRVYVINFWASWCVPCRKETSALEGFYERWKPQGVELIGVSYSDPPGPALAFRAQYGGTWPLVNDPNLSVALSYGVAGVPETFVIDEKGIIRAKLIGAVGPTTLDGVLERIYAGATVEERNNDYRTQPGT